MTGFGDGVRPPIMTGSDAKAQMDAFDPSLHEILGAETATLVNLDDAMTLEGGVDGIMTVAHPPLGAELMDKLKPKVISNCGVGVMHIDLDAASARGIPVVRITRSRTPRVPCLRVRLLPIWLTLPRGGTGAQGNTPGVLNEATADMALTLMLACARRLPEADAYCKSGQWERYEHMSLVGQDVTGSTVGIIGLGRIGSEIAKRARLGAPCVRCSTTRMSQPARCLNGGCA